jgi:thioredoxin 1
MPNVGSKLTIITDLAQPIPRNPGFHGDAGSIRPLSHRSEVLMAQAITTLSTQTFDEIIGAATGAIVVDFWAEWCGPCKMIAPILEEIASENHGAIQVAKLNVDDHPDLARRFDVMSIPTLIVFKDGAPAKRLIGAKGKGQLLQELGEFL